jgi:hypothetical protein
VKKVNTKVNLKLLDELIVEVSTLLHPDKKFINKISNYLPTEEKTSTTTILSIKNCRNTYLQSLLTKKV